MTWQGIEGHDDVVELFRRSLARGRLASTFLFVGPPGVGKRAFADKLAKALLCQQSPTERLEPCGRCDSCVQVAALTHPDLTIVEKPPDKSSIPISALVGEENRRMREGLCHDIALKPFMGGRKVAIIDDADALGEESANCLLKTLEEPPPGSVLILIGTSPDRQLPTIRSRAQMIRFRPLPAAVVSELLQRQGIVADAAAAARAADYAEGSLQRAVELADEELWAFRKQLLSALSRIPLESVSLAGELVAVVDAAGKEAPPRRARARQLLGFAVDFLRQLLRATADSDVGGDSILREAVGQAAGRWPGGSDGVLSAIDRTLEALAQIDRNAHLTSLLECWLDDLARQQLAALAPAAPRV